MNHLLHSPAQDFLHSSAEDTYLWDNIVDEQTEPAASASTAVARKAVAASETAAVADAAEIEAIAAAALQPRETDEKRGCNDFDWDATLVLPAADPLSLLAQLLAAGCSY